MIIAITGKICSGKSTVLDLFALCGFKTINLDKRVKELYYPSSPIFPKLQEFLKDYFIGDHFDFTKIKNTVNENDRFDAELKSIIYPELEKELLPLSEEKEIYIVEIPLVYESGFYTFCKKVVYIKVADELSREWVKDRSGFTLQDKIALERKFFPEWMRIWKADYVIENKGDDQLFAQVSLIAEKLRLL